MGGAPQVELTCNEFRLNKASLKNVGKKHKLAKIAK